MDQLAANLGMVVDEKHGASRPGAGRGCGQTGRACADDKKIAARVELRIVGRRAIVWIDTAEAGHRADRAFEGLPAWQKESLVVEAGRQDRRESVDQGGAIGGRRRRRVDRAHGKIVLERFRGRTQVRRRLSVARHVDDRVRLLRPGAPHAARPMVLEASADNSDAARQ